MALLLHKAVEFPVRTTLMPYFLYALHLLLIHTVNHQGHDPRIYESTVKEFIKDKNGNLKAVKIVKLAWEKDAASGRMNMKEVPGSEQEIPADIVLIAAGFLGTQNYIADAFGVELNERTNVKTETGKYQTSRENVFVTGDMHRGQSLVVWAIREGREAARAVDESLMGYSNLVVQ